MLWHRLHNRDKWPNVGLQNEIVVGKGRITMSVNWRGNNGGRFLKLGIVLARSFQKTNNKQFLGNVLQN